MKLHLAGYFIPFLPSPAGLDTPFEAVKTNKHFSDNGCHSRTHTNTEVENALEQVTPEESSFFHGNVKAVLLGLLWEVSGDRTGLSNTADGATRSQTWPLHQRTCVSGRLNGCLNTHRLVNKGQIALGG